MQNETNSAIIALLDIWYPNELTCVMQIDGTRGLRRPIKVRRFPARMGVEYHGAGAEDKRLFAGANAARRE